MDRVKFLIEALEINKTQAMIIDAMIKDIPDDKLMDFIVYRINFIEPMQSKELITKNALFSFRKKQYLQMIKQNDSFFKSVDDLKHFCKAYFKGQDLCYGASDFFDYVIIAMDKDCNLINKFVVNDGFYLKLTSQEEAKVYLWLFENQKRIGDIKIVPYFESKTKALVESKREEIIDNRVLNLLRNTK